jgi:hypothetical protein
MASSLGDYINSGGFGQVGQSETPVQEANIGHLISSVAPLATSWSGPMRGSAVDLTQTPQKTPTNMFSEFAGFAHSTFNTITSLGEGVIHSAAKSIVDAGEAPFKLGIGAYELGKSAYNNHINSNTLNKLDEQQKSLQDNYDSGRISLSEYNKEAKDIAQQRNSLTKDISENEKLITHGAKFATEGDINTVGDLFAIATAGKSMTVSEALDTGASRLIDKMMFDGGDFGYHIIKGAQVLDHGLGALSKGLDKAVSWNGLFKPGEQAAIDEAGAKAVTNNIGEGLSPVVQDIAKTAENNAGTGASVLDRAKAVSVGLLIKRPLIYNTAVGNAQQMYHEMSTGKYGDAAKEAGLLGLMTLSGGPVGAALRYGGKLVSGAERQLFAKPTFIDNLSQYVGDKNVKGIANDLAQRLRDDPEAGTQVIRAIKILEDTNVNASNGSVVGAVQRIVDYHMLSAPETPLDQMTHHDFVDNLYKLGHSADLFDNAGKTGQLTGEALKAYQEGKYAFGRISQATKNWMASQFRDADSKVGAPKATAAEEPTAAHRVGDIIKDRSITDSEMHNIISINRQRFGDMNVKVGYTGDQKVRGMYQYKKDMITLANGNAKMLDTFNHESIHKAIGQFLSDAETEQLYKDIVRIRGGKSSLVRLYRSMGYTNIGWRGAADEHIANKFVEFLKDKKTIEDTGRTFRIVYWAEQHGLPKSIAETFYTLALRIDEHFKGKNADSIGRLSEFYKKVNSGGFKNAPRRESLYRTNKNKFQLGNSAQQTSIPTQADTSASEQDIQQYASAFDISEEQARNELTASSENGEPVQPKEGFHGPPPPTAEQIQARLAVLNQLDEKYGTHMPILNNVTLRNQINKLVQTEGDTETLVSKITAIEAGRSLNGLPEELKAEMKANSYTLISPKHIDAPYAKFSETNGKINTKFTSNDSFGSQYFQKSAQGMPVLKDIGTGLTRIGLSPDSADGAVYSIFNFNLRGNLSKVLPDIEMDVPIGESKADAIVNALSNYVKSNHNITDIRQLSTKEISKVLHTSEEDSKQVMAAVHEAMLKVPLQIRGLGDRVVDFNYKINPFAAKYARIQSAGKFAMNPFFKWQQVTTTQMFAGIEKKSIGGLAEAITAPIPAWNRIVSTIFPAQGARLKETVGALEKHGIFEGGFSGYAAEDQPAGKIGTHLLAGEKTAMAGLVNSMADRQGLTVEQFISNNSQEVIDTLRSFVQYPRGGNFINSPLARTLNIAFFPFRYNVKVTGMAAKVLAEQNKFVQLATIQGLIQAHTWLNTNEGLAWRQNNADAIGIFQWVSPLYSIGYVYDILNSGVSTIEGKKGEITMGEFGELGGLPFGIISQLLDAEGIIHINTPYVSPKNGQVLPKYVPKTALGAASAGLQSLIESLFTYPGAVAGLPSKGGIVRSAVNTATGAKTTKDFTKVVPTDLTPEEQQQQQVWAKGQPPQVTINGNVENLYAGPNIPVIPPEERNQALSQRAAANVKPSSSKGKRKKESEYTPAALPTQTASNVTGSFPMIQ